MISHLQFPWNVRPFKYGIPYFSNSLPGLVLTILWLGWDAWLIPLHPQDGAQGLSLEVGENHLVMGGSQQLYHLDAYIPLRINADESRAAFHRKRRVPGGGYRWCPEVGLRLLHVKEGGAGGWTLGS